MAKYRKLPAIIEASRWFADGDHAKVEMIKALVKDAMKVCKKCDHLLMDHHLYLNYTLRNKPYIQHYLHYILHNLKYFLNRK